MAFPKKWARAVPRSWSQWRAALSAVLRPTNPMRGFA